MTAAKYKKSKIRNVDAFSKYLENLHPYSMDKPDSISSGLVLNIGVKYAECIVRYS